MIRYDLYIEAVRHFSQLYRVTEREVECKYSTPSRGNFHIAAADQCPKS